MNSHGYRDSGSRSHSESDYDESDDEHDPDDYGDQVTSVILFLDVDCFEVQVWGKHLNFTSEQLKTLPFIVVNQHQVITAVNYVAKRAGIRREKSFTMEMAMEKCQNLQIITIPDHYEKPNTLIPKMESDKIYDAIVSSLERQCSVRPVIEKASKDEVYVDLSQEVFHRANVMGQVIPDLNSVTNMKSRKVCLETPGRMVSGETLAYRVTRVLTNPQLLEKRHGDEKLLIHGGAIATQVLSDVFDATGYILSGGVSSNKLLAKLGCGHRKPDGLCILPHSSFPRVSKSILIKDTPGLARKFGQFVQTKLRVKTLAQLAQVRRLDLLKIFMGEKGLMLHQVAIGFDSGKVVEKRFSTTLTAGITFGYRSRNMWQRTQESFLKHLRNRFHEMREHLHYEVREFGMGRVPVSFRLEIKSRKNSLLTAFGDTLKVCESLRRIIFQEASLGGALDAFGAPGNENALPPEWQVLLEQFLALIREKCELKVFHDEDDVACAEIRKISGINLKAQF